MTGAYRGRSGELSLFAIILGHIAPTEHTTTNLPLNVGW